MGRTELTRLSIMRLREQIPNDRMSRWWFVGHQL